GTRLEGTSLSRISNSRFDVRQGFYINGVSSTFGVYTDAASNVKVEGNTFNHVGLYYPTGVYRDLGVSSGQHTTAVPADIYRNTFTGLETQVQARGNNLGLQIDCNT